MVACNLKSSSEMLAGLLLKIQTKIDNISRFANVHILQHKMWCTILKILSQYFLTSELRTTHRFDLLNSYLQNCGKFQEMKSHFAQMQGIKKPSIYAKLKSKVRTFELGIFGQSQNTNMRTPKFL